MPSGRRASRRSAGRSRSRSGRASRRRPARRSARPCRRRRPARETVGGVHRDRAHAVVAEVLLHLRDERRASSRRAGVIWISTAWRISGRRSGKTASITTPLISTILPVLAPFSLGMGLLEALGQFTGQCMVRMGAAWKREPATCVTKRRSDARQAAVAYRSPGSAAHGNGRSAIVPARPRRGRLVECSALRAVRWIHRISIVRSGAQTLRPRTPRERLRVRRDLPLPERLTGSSRRRHPRQRRRSQLARSSIGDGAIAATSGRLAGREPRRARDVEKVRRAGGRHRSRRRSAATAALARTRAGDHAADAG